MPPLSPATATLPTSTDAALLGLGLLVLGILYQRSQAQVSRHRWLRLLLGLLTVGVVLFALGKLFWPVNGVVVTLATQVRLVQPPPLTLLDLVMGSLLVMGSCVIGYALTFLLLIGWKLLSNSQGPSRLKLRPRWFTIFLPAVIFLLAQAVNTLGVLSPIGGGIVLLVGFQLSGVVGALDPRGLQWVDTLYQGGLKKMGYVLLTVGMVVVSLPYLVLF